MGFLTKKPRIAHDLKQVILIREDLKLPRGKAAAQAAHASVEAVLRSNDDVVDEWHAQGMKKIVLKVADEESLLRHQREAKRKGLVSSLITDAGKTVVAPGTKTCVAIGPAQEAAVDAVTGELPMY
ncbi:peptidyl-tRNA hydrolase [Candidatus Woesearchaeota archaeon]|nr:peptidyl-tRNA hydrolase [Candidatus Woesearchaeota archaeon]